MNRVFFAGSVVLIACLTGLGGVWADQALVDSLQQDAQALGNQVSANESMSDSAKSIKLGNGSGKTSAKKSTKKKSKKTKKSTTKKAKKSKSKKSKKKSEPAA
jgi:hypothetical protein